VFVVWFSQIIATEEEVKGWDVMVDLPGDAEEVCDRITGVIEPCHEDGVPMWPYVASSLHGSISRGDFGSGRGRLRITHDASWEGYAAFVEWAGHRKLVVATFTESERT